MEEKTLLGIKLRRLIISVVNGMGRGDHIRVQFRGTRAYTDGKNINLPAIRDLAEIPYSTARALIGYAIHEVAHIRYTDFEAIIRAIESGKMEPDKLIKKFENAIEDYRIERIISAELPGTASDLTALRNLIHPNLKRLKPEWLADPRACGPLALTWTGSQINGFVIPAMQDTLDAFPAPVRALIDNWTARMKNVDTTDEVIDLAIAFTDEALAYANASRPQTPTPPASNQSSSDDQEEDQDDAAITNSDDSQSAEEPEEENSTGDQENQAQPDEEDSPEDSSEDGDPTAEASGESGGGDPNQLPSAGNADDQDASGEVTANPGNVDADGPDAPGSAQSDNDAQHGPGRADPDCANDTAEGSADHTADENSGQPSSDDSSNGVDDLNFAGSHSQDKSSPNGSGQEQSSDPTGQIDMNNGMTDAYEDGADTSADQSSSRSDDQSHSSTPNTGEQENDDPVEGDADQSASNDSSATTSGNRNADSPSDSNDDCGDDPLKDILDEDAEFDDFIDDLRDHIAANPLPEDAPEADDGEVNPSDVLNNVKDANAAAPNYTSPDPDPDAKQSQDQPGGRNATKHHYSDERFSPIDHTQEDDNQYATLRANAAGIISTTARTIRRLLMAEEQRGVLRGRRDGQFDIRNISAIVRGTGTCYKRKWERPAPETHLTILADFSGSMLHGNGADKPLALAMTGALAIEEATRNSQIETSIYGFQGYSPHVILYPFKEGKQSATITRRNIGAYRSLDLGCTPTGEAMAAVADLLDEIENKRRILLVLTDGDADDEELCQGVVGVLTRRGIEVVAIGIQSGSVRRWCPNSHVIHDVTELPQALLSTIDPRAHKKLKRAA